PKGKSGFDCVIGNPPYVKLQHFRQVLPDVAEYLLSAERTAADGPGPLYASTQTQNFDMYLPFIEKGIELLNTNGHMGFIAPNVWLLNEYGDGLRRQIKKTRRLERWVDFKDYPVFDEAMTYTALQFYRGKPSNEVSCAFVPDGELGAIEWATPDALIPYSELPGSSVWVLLPKRERAFLDRLGAVSARLDGVATGIIVGIQTSADYIYHMERVAIGRYRHFPKGKPPVELELEDSIMRPLITGDEARRYQSPITETYLLFPYIDDGGRERLFKATEMVSRFPKAWKYLLTYERDLRKREGGAFDDDEWFRFGRNQNIDKQKLPKLGVAQTVPEMRVFYDHEGAYCFNNVRVNAILVEDKISAYFLMGILNSRVVDFVFRRIAKSKERRPSGAYFEANKQYIAPLPIPRVSDKEKKQVASMAKELQKLHSERRNTIAAIDQRLASDQMLATPRLPKWLWADVGDVPHWSTRNNDGLKGRALTAWAKQVCDEKLAGHLAEIGDAMSYGATMCAALKDGELRFYVRDRCVISGVYVSEQEAPLILAQWRRAARDTFVSDSVNAARVVEWLLELKTTESAALIAQVRKLNDMLSTIESRIKSTERMLDDLGYALYGLTEAERLMVELDTRPRWEARIPAPPT
ncbi:MAG: Eco57I restriction-modification methylase domain-containing protein, partial [Minicystis sp.]